MRSSKRKKYK